MHTLDLPYHFFHYYVIKLIPQSSWTHLISGSRCSIVPFDGPQPLTCQRVPNTRPSGRKTHLWDHFCNFPCSAARSTYTAFSCLPLVAVPTKKKSTKGRQIGNLGHLNCQQWRVSSRGPCMAPARGAFEQRRANIPFTTSLPTPLLLFNS